MAKTSKIPSNYESGSKVDMKELREAAQKVFAFDPSASRKGSTESPPVKHRRSAQKNAKRTAD